MIYDDLNCKVKLNGFFGYLENDRSLMRKAGEYRWSFMIELQAAQRTKLRDDRKVQLELVPTILRHSLVGGQG